MLRRNRNSPHSPVTLPLALCFAFEIHTFKRKRRKYTKNPSQSSKLKGFPITGSLSFGGGNGGSVPGGGVGGGIPGGGVNSTIEAMYPRKSSTASGATVYQIPITYEGKPISSQPAAAAAAVVDAGGPTATAFPALATAKPSPASRNPAARKNVQATTMTSSQQKVTTTTKTMHLRSMPSEAAELQIEPKLPTSISNIGGAILRSKTADFERMSTAMPVAGASGAPVGAPRRVRQNPAAPDGGTPPRNTLYKRQELISSAKRTSK